MLQSSAFGFIAQTIFFKSSTCVCIRLSCSACSAICAFCCFDSEVKLSVRLRQVDTTELAFRQSGLFPLLVAKGRAVNFKTPPVTVRVDAVISDAKTSPLTLRVPGTLTTSPLLPRTTVLLKLATAPAPTAVAKVGAGDPGSNRSTLAPLPIAVLLLPSLLALAPTTTAELPVLLALTPITVLELPLPSLLAPTNVLEVPLADPELKPRKVLEEPVVFVLPALPPTKVF